MRACTWERRLLKKMRQDAGKSGAPDDWTIFPFDKTMSSAKLWQVAAGKRQRRRLLPRRSIAVLGWPGCLLRCTGSRSIHVAQGSIRINAGSFGGKMINCLVRINPTSEMDRAGTKEARIGGSHEFACRQGKRDSVKAALGRSDRARCAFFRDRRAQPRRERQRG